MESMEVERHYRDTESVITNDGFRYRKDIDKFRIEEIKGETLEKIFEKFYEMQNRLRYCNGSYYKFSDKENENKYNEWYRALSKDVKFSMYYGGGIVD